MSASDNSHPHQTVDTQNVTAIIDEREISHPIMTHSENIDNTMWPMALYSICPQYRFKHNDYWLFNQVYGDANRAAYMGKDGVIKKELKTVVKGIPFIITI